MCIWNTLNKKDGVSNLLASFAAFDSLDSKVTSASTIGEKSEVP